MIFLQNFLNNNMNELINIENEYGSYVGTVQSMIESHGKTYQIRLKKDILDDQIIEKQNIVIAKLKSDNNILKNYLSKAVVQLKELKQSKQKISLNTAQYQDMNEYISNLQIQNNDLKKELQEIQSDLAKYKDAAQRQRDDLQQEIIQLKRQLQQNIEGFQTLQYVNQRRELEINQKQKQIWQLQSNIAELTQSNYDKQSFIDRFKVFEDERASRDNFRYLGSGISKKSRNSDDILIEGEQFMTTSQYGFVEKFNYGVQTEIIDAFQLSNRFLDRTPTKRKNHHMSPENDKDQKIRQYARQLTQKEKQCANQQKAYDLLKKQNKKLQEKIKEKEKQLKKEHKKYKKLTKKFGVSTNVQFSADSSDDMETQTPGKRLSKLSIDFDTKFSHDIEIQTDETRLQNKNVSNQKNQQTGQKRKNKSNISEPSSILQPGKKQKRRKNRTIQNDQQDGREKLKSLIEDLQKKQNDIHRLQSQSNRNRQVLNETRSKLRKKQNECKRLSKQLRNLKNQLSQKDSNFDNGSSLIQTEEDKSKTSKVYLNEQIQTEQLQVPVVYQKPKHRRTLSEANPLIKNSGSNIKISQKIEITEMQQIKNETQAAKQDEDKLSVQQTQKQPERLNIEDLKILFPKKQSQQIVLQQASPRSESYSHRQNGQRIIDIQKLQKLNEYLRQQNAALQQELDEFKKNWIEGLKNIQRQYCSESGSDFHSDRDIIGALSDREMLPRKFRQRFQQQRQSDHHFKNDEKIQRKCVQTQTQQIEEEIILMTRNEEMRRSNRIIEDKTQKSQARSDDLHNSHSKNEIDASSETDEHHFELKTGGQFETKKKKIRHNLTLQQEKLRLKNKQNYELRRQIKQLQKALQQAKKSQNIQIKKHFLKEKSQQEQQKKPQQNIQQIGSKQQQFIPSHVQAQQSKQSRYLSIQNNTINQQIRVNIKLLQSSQIHRQQQQVQISCIQKMPQKGIELSLRNENLFELQHHGVCDADIQTEYNQLSLGNSFFLQSKQLEIQSNLNVMDIFRKVQSKLQTIQLSSHQQQHQHQKHDNQQIMNRNLQEQHQDRQQLLMRITQMQIKLKQITQQLDRQRQKSPITEDNIQQQLKQQQQQQKGVDEMVQIEFVQENKQGSKYPSYMDDSSSVQQFNMKNKELVDMEVQTEDIMSSFIQIHRLNDKKHDNYQDEESHQDQLQLEQPQIKKTVSEEVIQEQKDVVMAIQQQQQVQVVIPVVTFDQSQVIVMNPVETVYKPNKKEKAQHVEWKTQPHQRTNQTKSYEIHSRPPVLSHNTPLTHQDAFFVQFREIESQMVFDQRYEKKSQSAAAKSHKSKNLEQSIVDIHVDSQMMGSKNIGAGDSLMSVSQCIESKIINVNNNRSLKITKKATTQLLDAVSIKQKQKFALISQQLTQQVNIYKQQLLLTQQMNFKLQKQVHEINSQINSYKKEIKQLNKKVQQKDSIITEKENKLLQSSRLLTKLKSEYDQAVSSLERHVNDINGESSISPDKAKYYIPGRNKQFMKSDQKSRMLDQFKQNIILEEDERQQFSLKNIQEMQQPLVLNIDHSQHHPKLAPHALSFSQEAVISSLAKESLKYSESVMSVIKTDVEQESQFVKKGIVEREDQKELQKEHEQKPQNVIKPNQQQSQTETVTLSMPPLQSQSQINSHILQSQIIQTPLSEQKQRQKYKQTLLVQMMIHQTQSQILKCKQCILYSNDIRRLEQQINRLTSQMQDLQKQVIRREQIDDGNVILELKENQDDLEQQQNVHNQDQKQLFNNVEKNKIEYGLPFIEQIDIRPVTQHNNLTGEDQEVTGIEVQTTQIIIPESENEQTQQQLLQNLTYEDIDNVFTIENIQFLPYIYYEYQQQTQNQNLNKNINSKSAPVLNTSRVSSSLRQSRQFDRKSVSNKSNQNTIQQAQRRLQQLYQPAFVVDSQQQRQYQQQRVVFKFTAEQQCQTEEILVSYKEIEEQKLQKEQILHEKLQQKQKAIVKEQNIFPLLFVSPLSQQTDQFIINNHKQRDLFNPIFITSQQNQSNQVSKQTLTPLYSQLNQLLVENYLTTCNQFNSSPRQVITQKLSYLGLKVFQWLSTLKNQHKTKQKQNNQSFDKQDQLLLDEQDINDYQLKNDSKISQRKSKIYSTEIIKNITDNLGPHFLFLQSQASNISHQNFLTIALQIESKYLSLNTQKLSFR